jgi:hypothetical protein
VGANAAATAQAIQQLLAQLSGPGGGTATTTAAAAAAPSLTDLLPTLAPSKLARPPAPPAP